MLLYICLAGAGLVLLIRRRKLYPKPYPGIPYAKAPTAGLIGDVLDLLSAIQESNEVADSMFAVSTRKLGTPISQVIFPRFREPLIVVDDPYEVEDILMRRHSEFDKSPMAVDIFTPMFAHGTLSQFTTPQLKAQKRLWAEAMNTSFLRQAVAPRVHETILDLVHLWRLKTSDQAFNAHDDFMSATLDVIWGALIGETLGTVRQDIRKLQSLRAGDKVQQEKLPRGAFVRPQVAYINETISRNSRTLVPTWSQKLETYTPRYRKFRKTVTKEVTLAMRNAADRFERTDTASCMMDLVLRRRALDAEKAGITVSDPTTDPAILDEMFVILVGGYDSTASTLSWFVRFMETYPAIQSQLRSILQGKFQQLPSVSQIFDTDIPYLDAVCEETFRLAGTSKGNLRQAMMDTEILGYKIPKGAEVLLNMHINASPYPVDDSKRSLSSRTAMAKHGNGFMGAAGQNLNSFEPRRWLEEDPVTGREVFNAYSLPSLAFGGGYRGCFGRKLANIEFRIAVALLILNFEFLELPEEYKTMRACESIFRHPEAPFVRIRPLEFIKTPA
ncbi:cytochrome P450 [Xylaria arbuscula]|nr:cytochrome P450 [Xylaria arbuscula]